ncbi:response regulator transcription factor [Bacillus infantis]|uniref:response regulator transcription factor n=1 Tax=Bacillus infantis TaxID=324767 RepID=UPI0021558BB8|nr:response regulator transcription factor [Bacillus infantis]MCR6613240.1 response regulator transcription factor [Bacillus infantis]
MKTILLVDDEERMKNLLALFLEPHGYKTLRANGGYEAIQLVKRMQVDMLLLDIMMPELDGLETCRKIREFSNIPVIMVTARSDNMDMVKGFDCGADDYVTKPFDERVLLARVNALFRRQQIQQDAKEIIRGDFKLDTDSYTLKYKGKAVSLTLKEFLLLETLMKHPERVYTRDQLLAVAWDINASTEIRTVDSHVRNLREKLKRASFPIEEHLATVWGIGYQWKIK